MTIKKTFLPPEYWYVKKDTSHVHWLTFEKWFRYKGHIREEYNGHWDYFTYDMDGYNILPNPPKKTAKSITLEQWIHWYSLQEKTVKPLSQKRAEAIERGKEVTILEKLKTKLEKEREIANDSQELFKHDEWRGHYHYGISQLCSELLELLTSLETPQFTPGQEEAIEDKIELVPEYEEIKQGRHTITGDRKDKQISIITEKLNEVIKKINT